MRMSVPWVPAFAGMTTRSRYSLLRRSITVLCMFCLSLTATTCLNDNPAGPGSAPLKLSIAAQISGQAENEWRVGIRVFYTRTTEAEVNLPVSPPEVFVERGVSTTRDVSVQIGSCLSDTERTNLERGGCTFIVELSLLDESGDFPVVFHHENLHKEEGRVGFLNRF